MYDDGSQEGTWSNWILDYKWDVWVEVYQENDALGLLFAGS